MVDAAYLAYPGHYVFHNSILPPPTALLLIPRISPLIFQLPSSILILSLSRPFFCFLHLALFVLALLVRCFLGCWPLSLLLSQRGDPRCPQPFSLGGCSSSVEAPEPLFDEYQHLRLVDPLHLSRPMKRYPSIGPSILCLLPHHIHRGLP